MGFANLKSKYLHKDALLVYLFVAFILALYLLPLFGVGQNSRGDYYEYEYNQT